MPKLQDARVSILKNRSTKILSIVSDPNVKKAFYSMFFTSLTPVIYLDFSRKVLRDKESVFKKYNMDIYVQQPEKVNADIVISCIGELKRGTIILDDFNFMYWQDQCLVAEAMLDCGTDIRFTLGVQSYLAATKRKFKSVVLPTVLIQDKRVTDFLFIRGNELTMLGKERMEYRL